MEEVVWRTLKDAQEDDMGRAELSSLIARKLTEAGYRREGGAA